MDSSLQVLKWGRGVGFSVVLTSKPQFARISLAGPSQRCVSFNVERLAAVGTYGLVLLEDTMPLKC